MTWYVDSSAWVKTLVVEPESAALEAWLPERALTSSALLRTEAVRAVRPQGVTATRRAADSFAQLLLLPISDEILLRAADLWPARLRTLDAIHLASALLLGSELQGVLTYDHRMAAAAASLGIPVEAPA